MSFVRFSHIVQHNQQHSNMVPAAVGQHSPVKPSALHLELAAHVDPILDFVDLVLDDDDDPDEGYFGIAAGCRPFSGCTFVGTGTLWTEEVGTDAGA